MILLISGLSGNWAQYYRELAANVGVLVNPRSWNKPQTQLREGGGIYAMDNDCFQGLNEPVYREMLDVWQGIDPKPLWVTAPDVVADAPKTLELFDRWEPILHGLGYPVALVGQDGQENLPLPWNRIEALFIGGSTEWKLSESAFRLGREAKERGKRLHVGRVNSLRRMELAARMGADTIDGSGYSKWKKLIAPGVRFLRRAKWLAEHQPLLWD